MGVKSAIYVRISADQTGEGLGVTRQLEDCEALAQRLGYDVVATYDDNDCSAYSGRRRPGFEKMVADMKARTFGALIAWHPDRLYRSMKDLERLIDACDTAGVQIRTVNGGDLDLGNATGKMLARILGSVSRQESEHKAERQVRAYIQKAQSGRWQTGRRPFGYTQHGIPCEPEATAFRTAVRDVLAGKSLRKVSMEWNAQGLTTSTGGTWGTPQVRRTLMKPRYAGLKVHQGKVVGPGDWEALIDEATHYGLVRYLSDPKRVVHTGFERKYQGSSVYLCGVCRTPMKSTSGRGRARTYVCGRASCVTRVADPVDDYISALVIGRLSQSDVALHLRPGAEVDVGALQARRIALQTKLDELTVLFNDNDIDASQLRRGSTDLHERMRQLDSELADAVLVSPAVELLAGRTSAEVTADRETIAERWGQTTPDKRSKIIEELMTVTVLPSPRGSKGFHPEYIQIDWKTA